MEQKEKFDVLKENAIEEEKWKPVKNFEGSYEVSNTGEVKSLNRITLVKGKKRVIIGRFLKPKNNGQGYQFVTLSIAGKTKNCYVHRLVAESFISNPNFYQEVNHINGCKADNRAENLEWVCHSSNVKHAYENNLTTNKAGNHFMATGVIDNELGETYGSIKEWCEARNINYSTGRNILLGYSTLKTVEKTKLIKLINQIENGAEY